MFREVVECEKNRRIFINQTHEFEGLRINFPESVSHEIKTNISFTN